MNRNSKEYLKQEADLWVKEAKLEAALFRKLLIKDKVSLWTRIKRVCGRFINQKP